MDNLTTNIKRVMIIFLIVFVVLMGYLGYFTLVKGPKIVTRPDNRRMWDIRNKVVRVIAMARLSGVKSVIGKVAALLFTK